MNKQDKILERITNCIKKFEDKAVETQKEEFVLLYTVFIDVLKTLKIDMLELFLELNNNQNDKQ